MHFPVVEVYNELGWLCSHWTTTNVMKNRALIHLFTLMSQQGMEIFGM